MKTENNTSLCFNHVKDFDTFTDLPTHMSCISAGSIPASSITAVNTVESKSSGRVSCNQKQNHTSD